MIYMLIDTFDLVIFCIYILGLKTSHISCSPLKKLVYLEVLTKELKLELEHLISGNQLEISARKGSHFTFS